MIVYDLICAHQHRFEGWFASSGDYAGQRARGLVSCPQCGSGAVEKAPMAPAVPRKANSRAANGLSCSSCSSSATMSGRASRQRQGRLGISTGAGVGGHASYASQELMRQSKE